MLCPQSCPLCWMYFSQYELHWADRGKGTSVSCEKGSRVGGLTHTVCSNISMCVIVLIVYVSAIQ